MKLRKELNNKGFSLVELLIATIILGIVVAPLLHTFVVSAKTAARGSQLGDAVLDSPQRRADERLDDDVAVHLRLSHAYLL